MSSRCEVLIRILALLQRKMFIETKNRTLKYLKWHYSTVRSMKKGCSVDGGQGICLLFSSLPWGIRRLNGPHPWEFAIQGKKMLVPGVSVGWGVVGGGAGHRWNWLMHNDFHFCNVKIDNFATSIKYLTHPFWWMILFFQGLSFIFTTLT